MLSYNKQEPGHWNADWDVRMEWTIKLFKEGLFQRCIADCRTMLLYRRLPHEYEIYCHALIAASLRDQDEAEVRQCSVQAVGLSGGPYLPSSSPM
jgi:hypothetical protein